MRRHSIHIPTSRVQEQETTADQDMSKLSNALINPQSRFLPSNLFYDDDGNPPWYVDPDADNPNHQAPPDTSKVSDPPVETSPPLEDGFVLNFPLLDVEGGAERELSLALPDGALELVNKDNFFYSLDSGKTWQNDYSRFKIANDKLNISFFDEGGHKHGPVMQFFPDYPKSMTLFLNESVIVEDGVLIDYISEYPMIDSKILNINLKTSNSHIDLDNVSRKNMFYSVDNGETWKNDFSNFEVEDGKLHLHFRHDGDYDGFHLKYLTDAFNEPEAEPTVDPTFSPVSGSMNDGEIILHFSADQPLTDDKEYDVSIATNNQHINLDVVSSDNMFYSVDGGNTWENDFTRLEVVNDKLHLEFRHHGEFDGFHLKYLEEAFIDAEETPTKPAVEKPLTTIDPKPEPNVQEPTDPEANTSPDLITHSALKFIRTHTEGDVKSISWEFKSPASIGENDMFTIHVPEEYREILTGKFWLYQNGLNHLSVKMDASSNWTIQVPFDEKGATNIYIDAEIRDDYLFESDEWVSIDFKIPNSNQWIHGEHGKIPAKYDENEPQSSTPVNQPVEDKDTSPENDASPNADASPPNTDQSEGTPPKKYNFT